MGWFYPLAALTLLGAALVGLPAVLFAAAALWVVAQRRWVRLGLLLLAVLAAGVALGWVSLRFDWPTPEPGDHYSWAGWYALLLPAAYAVGVMLFLGRAGSFVARLWRRLRGRPAPAGA
jgi:hypothetical protein